MKTTIIAILGIFTLLFALRCEMGVSKRSGGIYGDLQELYQAGYADGYQQSDIDHAVNIIKKKGWMK